MSFTWSNNPAGSNRDLMRMLLRDTSSSSMKFSDEELAWYVANSASVWYAAAEACDTYAGKLAESGSKTVGDLSITRAVGDYRMTAQRFRARGARAAIPYAGGITVSDKDTETGDSDRVASAFRIGMHDEIGSSTGSTGY